MKHLFPADNAAPLRRLSRCSKCVFRALGLLGCGGFEMQLREWLKEEETANIQLQCQWMVTSSDGWNHVCAKHARAAKIDCILSTKRAGVSCVTAFHILLAFKHMFSEYLWAGVTSYIHIHGTHSSEGKRRQGKKDQRPRSNSGPTLYLGAFQPREPQSPYLQASHSTSLEAQVLSVAG